MARTSFFRMLVRGAFRRCPSCGGRGAFFTSWFAKDDACRTCGLRWRRDDVGFELGAAAMAAIIVVGPLVLALGVVLAVTWPDVAVVPLMIVFVPAGLVLPILLYPMSYTMWQAVDLTMRPPSPSDYVRGSVDSTSITSNMSNTSPTSDTSPDGRPNG